MILNGSEILLESLLEQGVDVIFGYPGGAVLNIYDALYTYNDKILHIETSHEQAAAHAADGYARTTGKVGVVIATSGPGATNLVTGIATAYMDSVPIVAITGNVATSLLGLDSFQEVDITGVTAPITKHNFIVKDVSKLAETVKKAFEIANSGRKGPVLIDIPKDISANTCEFYPNIDKSFLSETNNEIAIDSEILDAISSAKKPFLYVGGGAVSAAAQQEIAEFARKIDAPVALTLMGQTAFSNSDKRYVGMLGMHGTKTASLAALDCDVFIVVGSRFSDRVTCNLGDFEQIFSDKTIVQIDIDPAEINKNVKVTHSITGDIIQILTKLNSVLVQQNNDEWIGQIDEWKSEFPLYQYSENCNDVMPKFVLEELRKLAPANSIVTTEVGQHQIWTAQYFDFLEPYTFASSGGLGTMGYGLGAAIGAKMGNPDRLVVNVAGDGSFYMNLNELSTLAKYNIPVIELVFNNSVLGMVRQWQKLFYGGRFSETNLEKNTDFEMLAKAFGIEYLCISRADEVADVLKTAINMNKPVLINCIIDKDLNVLPMVPAGKSIAEPILKL